MAPAPASARIFLLGRFAVEVAERVIPSSAWRKRRPVEVLTALALAPGHSLHREELIDRCWPDKALDAGANNLHRALHDLRRTSGADLVTLERGVVRIVEGVWVDVAAFEQAARSAEPEALLEAVRLYRGALLPEDPYSDVLAARREGLRQRFVDAALRLASWQRERADAAACIAVLRQLLECDPALEPAHRLLMTVLAEQGRAADALEQFGECVSALRQHLDAAPARATLELKSAVEQGRVAAVPGLLLDEVATAPRVAAPGGPAALSSPPPPEDARSAPARRWLPSAAGRRVHGRDDALAALDAFLSRGRGVLLVSGQAGLGKTRLAAELMQRAAAEGVRVLFGRGFDPDAGVPYASFADAWAEERRAGLCAPTDDPFLSFVPGGGSAQEDRLRLFQSVERALERLASGAPVCLVLEDLHQSDQSSLHLFHHLARASASLPLFLVGTLRQEEVRVGNPLHTLLGSLGRERLAERITLERLERSATARLVEELWREAQAPSGCPLTDELQRRVYALSEGNPFYTEEVVRAMRESQSVEPSLPANLLETVRLRVTRLGRDVERLLAAAAIIGQSFRFEVARGAAGLDAELALDALEQALDAQLVAEEGDAYRFHHALIRQALLDALTHARRVHLHRAAAQAIESQGQAARDEQAEVLALHHERAGQLAQALPYLLAAAERAQQRLGFAEAVAFLERALEWLDATGSDDAATRFAVLRRAGGMRLALSDLDRSVRDLDAAAQLLSPSWQPAPGELARVCRIAALALIQGGRLDEASQRLERALAVLGGVPDDAELPAVLYLFAQLRWHEDRYREAQELAQRSLSEAERRADRAAMAKGHEMLALCCHSLGDWQEGHAHERQRQQLAAGSLDVDQAFDVHLCLWEYHLYGPMGPGGIRPSVAQTLEQAQRMQAPRALGLCKSFGGALDFQAGRWHEAEAQLREAVQLFRQVGSASGEALSLQRLGVLLTARGQLEPARSALDDGIVVGGRAAMRSHCLTRLHASLARNRLAAGDRNAALASLEEGLAEVARHGHCSTCNALLLPEAVRVELAFEHLREAEQHAVQLERVAERFGSRAWTAMARCARGRVLAARGEQPAALAALEAAGKDFAELGHAYEAARVLLLRSRLKAALPGDEAAARQLAEQAAAALAALGATTLEA